MPIGISEALNLVSKLSRTRNFPQSDEAVEDFARALIRASEMIAVDAALIIQRCADVSEFCPTDADLLAVARDLKEDQRRKDEAASPSQAARWRKQYGPPQPFEMNLANQPDWYPEAKAKIKRREEMWDKLKLRFPLAGKKGHDWPDWGTLAKAARELGYPEYADAWERAVKW